MKIAIINILVNQYTQKQIIQGLLSVNNDNVSSKIRIKIKLNNV